MAQEHPFPASTTEPATSPIRRPAGLASEIYDTIFSQLMALKIPPGSRITVDTLAREFGVSQTPIREALGRLEGEGLVIKTHLMGYSAAPQLTRAQFSELYELRLLLEPDAARRVVANLDASNLSALTEAAGVMARRSNKKDERARYSEFARQDAIFHDLILKEAGNQLVRGILAHQHVHFHIFRLLFHSRVTEEALAEHEAIITAFEHRDADAAERAMRVHIERSRDRILPVFE
ncbi:GntR family transcriptional regulator [Pelagibacterium flavum]|uniref:GntR family transcriptional regulator n=1 Tax=Pelagibacterium flavum TaxID=2984530 RepID=A0ABY6IPE3_9HYPH|nr:GntR family transcriptional regulator [Pelagibacterium sp. YIM 151497]UYQ72482.1 GntR family transcriptional regulator [Pelagibacterium sp. YIM 151497]